MAEQQTTPAGSNSLPVRVLKHLLRTTGVRSSGTILEVGPVRPQAMTDWKSLDVQATALTDSAPAIPTLPGQVLIGDVAGGMPVTAHSVDCVVLRGARTFEAGLSTPEAHLGAANLLSCLKPMGSLIVIGVDHTALENWKLLLSSFPVKTSLSQYQDGLGWWLSLQWLRGNPRVQLPFLRAEIGKDAMSRLQWHRLVRELLMKRVQPTPVESTSQAA